MPLYVVINEQGPSWEDKIPMRGQKGWDEHAKFINSLEAERFILLGGPLGNYFKHRAMLVVDAPDEQNLRMRLAEDPWMQTGVLRLIETYSWEVLVGKLN